MFLLYLRPWGNTARSNSAYPIQHHSVQELLPRSPKPHSAHCNLALILVMSVAQFTPVIEYIPKSRESGLVEGEGAETIVENDDSEVCHQ